MGTARGGLWVTVVRLFASRSISGAAGRRDGTHTFTVSINQSLLFFYGASLLGRTRSNWVRLDTAGAYTGNLLETGRKKATSSERRILVETLEALSGPEGRSSSFRETCLYWVATLMYKRHHPGSTLLNGGEARRAATKINKTNAS